MIDFHAHILPNIDDGSRSIDETFNLIKEAQNVGFDEIVLTPHYKETVFETDVAERGVWLDAITKNLTTKNIKAKLYLAKIKNSKEGRTRQTDFWWGPGVFLDAKYLFIRSCTVGPRDGR